MDLTTVFRFRRRRPRVVISHEQATRYLVDYHFGRLPREQEIEVEAHLRVCPRCASEGLRHEPTAKRAAGRKLEAVRPRKLPRRRRRFAVVAVLAGVVIVALMGGVVYAGGLPIVLGAFGVNAAATDGTRAAKASATPAVLKPLYQLGQPPQTVGAIAASPDGRLVAVSGVRAGKRGIEIWRLRTRTRLAVLDWPGNAVPGAVAWSPQGVALAAADQGTIAVWDMGADRERMGAPALRWGAALPPGRSARVYATRDGSSRPLDGAERSLDRGRFLLWGPDGTLMPAPVGAAPNGVAPPGGPLVGMWQEQGTHVFVAPDGTVQLGISPTDIVGQKSIVQWAPDGRHLFWTNLASRLAAAGTSTEALDQLPVPDAVVGVWLRRLARDGAGDVYAWLSPDARQVALCAPRATGSELRVFDVATGRVTAAHPTLCANLDASLVTWLPSSQALAIATRNAPVAVFPVTSPAP